MNILSIKILVIEDDPKDGRYLWELLRQAERAGLFPPFDMHQCDRLSTGLEILAHHQIELVIADLSLPDAQGLEAIKRLTTKISNTPLVVLTGDDDRDRGLQAVRLGAQDYLLKSSLQTDTLVRTLLFAMERSRQLQEIEEKRQSLENSKNHYDAVLKPEAAGKIIVNSMGLIQFLNAPAEVLLCQNSRDLIGKEVWFPVASGVCEILDIDHGDLGLVRVELTVENIEWCGLPAFVVSLRDTKEKIDP
jgi:DNA-binding NarL/FixJ family response regulator